MNEEFIAVITDLLSKIIKTFEYLLKIIDRMRSHLHVFVLITVIVDEEIHLPLYSSVFIVGLLS